MESVKREVELKEAKSISELSTSDRELLEAAKAALDGAWAPYSQFYVAAAVRLANGELIIGSNQENMAYPSGLCAERVAIFSAGARFPGVPVEAIAVTAKSPGLLLDMPVLCCGACLQSLSEYEKRYQQPMHMVLQGDSGPVWIAEGTKTFLPFQFDGEALKNEN